ncbi:hypothetical protein [Geoglobus acetivorans]|uniref:hypothetical protein n=1 Tax=Geoglobus acetivorans TaxID=565033 RepID=UPI00064F55F8
MDKYLTRLAVLSAIFGSVIKILDIVYGNKLGFDLEILYLPIFFVILVAAVNYINRNDRLKAVISEFLSNIIAGIAGGIVILIFNEFPSNSAGKSVDILVDVLVMFGKYFAVISLFILLFAISKDLTQNRE